VSRRLEIEVPEDEAGWRWIRGALEEAGIRVDGGLTSLHELRPFQFRETERLRRAVVPRARNEGSGAWKAPQPLAELALDTVTLELEGRRIRFREVEVEARPGVADPHRLVADVGAALRNAVGPAVLRPWSLSKLATGMALAGLAAGGDLDGVIAENGDLLPGGLDRLAGFRG
jgi:hypothetical protein